MSDHPEDVFRLFATPGGAQEEAKRDRIERSVFARVAALSLIHSISATSGCGSMRPEVYDVLAEWASTKPDFWSRTIGHLWRATLSQNEELTAGAIVANGIHASVSGIRGNWDFRLPRPISFRISDVILLSIRAGHIQSDHGTFHGVFEGDGATISLETASDGTVAWQSTGGKKRHMNAPRITVGDDVYHLVPSALASVELLPGHAKSEYDDQSVNITGSEQLSIALRNLENVSPEAYRWVSSVIREVIPLRAHSGNAGSTSSPWDCGTVALTMTGVANPVLFGEMLVHEASHQHFFLAKQLGPIDDGSDDCLYFSPLVGLDRPLEKMLLAYHAVVNMLLFYRSVRGRVDRPQARFIAKRTDYLFEKLNCISPVVSESTALTPLGKAMFEALYETECNLRASFSH